MSGTRNMSTAEIRRVESRGESLPAGCPLGEKNRRRIVLLWGIFLGAGTLLGTGVVLSDAARSFVSDRLSVDLEKHVEKTFHPTADAITTVVSTAKANRELIHTVDKRLEATTTLLAAQGRQLAEIDRKLDELRSRPAYKP